MAILTGLSWLCVRTTSDVLHVGEANDAGRKRLQGAEALPLIENAFSGQGSVHVIRKKTARCPRMDDFLYHVDSSNCWDNDLPIRF